MLQLLTNNRFYVKIFNYGNLNFLLLMGDNVKNS